jgi:hypothetical protein
MDHRRFDSIARAIAGGTGRRSVLKALIGGAAAWAVAAPAGVAAGEPCAGDHLECPRKELCLFNDAVGRLECTLIRRPGERLCKAPTEFTWCSRGAECCTYPEVRDPGGLQIVTNCCQSGVTTCDPQLGCVPVR